MLHISSPPVAGWLGFVYVAEAGLQESSRNTPRPLEAQSFSAYTLSQGKENVTSSPDSKVERPILPLNGRSFSHIAKYLDTEIRGKGTISAKGLPQV